MSDSLVAVDLPRQRRWSSKVRTGCQTCRARRVKCDETKPSCKNCTKKGRKCEYILVWRPTSLQEPEGLAGTIFSTAPLVQAPTPDAAFMEALRYFVLVWYPRLAVASIAEVRSSDSFQPHELANSNFSAPAFVMIQLSDRIMTLCRENRVLVQRGAVPGAVSLWHAFYEYMGKALAVLNEHISENYHPRLTLYRVVDLISLGLNHMDLPWRSHTRGFFALVQCYGGVESIMAEPVKPPELALHYVLTAAVWTDTTSPTQNHFEQLDDWTDDDCKTVVEVTMNNAAPCPTPIFLAVRRISRLRRAVAAGTPIADLRSIAETTAAQVLDFVPETWTEPYDLPVAELATLYARAHQAATVLYAMTSLPKALVRPFTASYQSAKRTSPVIHYRNVVRDAIVAERSLVKLPGRMCWPLAALAVVCQEGSTQLRAQVIGCLDEIRTSPAVACGPDHLLQTLPRYWASGKKGWDACFDTPIYPLS